MTRDELRERLKVEVARWEKKGFQELEALTYPVTYDTGVPSGPSFYQTEITLLEKTPEYIHLAVAVSNSGFSAFVPVTGDVIVPATAAK